MTYLNSAHIRAQHSRRCLNISEFIRRCALHLLLKRRSRGFDELPDRLLRDVGLEHLIDHKREVCLRHRLL